MPSMRLMRGASSGLTTATPSRRRVTLLDLCSRRWRRPAFWRMSFPLPDTLNRFEAPLWLFILGMESSVLVTWWILGNRLAGRSLGSGIAGRRCFRSCFTGSRCGRSRTRSSLSHWRLSALLRLDTSLGALVRCQDHRHVSAVLLCRGFDESEICDVCSQTLQKAVAEFGA